MLTSHSASLTHLDCKDTDLAFWHLWQEYQDYLYRCCLKWMGGNAAEAEDALSQAMLKAREKVQDCAITNFKAWLIQLTKNVCWDIHRERNRISRKLESWEEISCLKDEELVSQEETPDHAAMRHDLENFFGHAINDLADRLRETFLLHFEQELSYQEIAEQLNISYDNVRKRISQARAILREHLAEYLGEKEGTIAYLKVRKSKQKEAVKDENLVLSEELKELEVVAIEKENTEQSEQLGFCKLEESNSISEQGERRGFCRFVQRDIFESKESRFLSRGIKGFSKQIIFLWLGTLFLRGNTFNKEVDSS